MANTLKSVQHADAVLAVDRWAMHHHRPPTLADLRNMIEEIEHDQRLASAREALAAKPGIFGQQYSPNDERREQDQRIAKEALAMLGAVRERRMTMSDVAARCRQLAHEQPDLCAYWDQFASQIGIPF